MKKVPTPVVVASLVIIILVIGFVLYRNASHTSGGGDAGDTKAFAAEIIKNNPKGELPPGANPTAGAVGMGGGGKGKK